MFVNPTRHCLVLCPEVGQVRSCGLPQFPLGYKAVLSRTALFIPTALGVGDDPQGTVIFITPSPPQASAPYTVLNLYTLKLFQSINVSARVRL